LITSSSSSGLALTAADAGNTNIRVGGPPQLKSFLHTTRYFMKLNDGLLNFHTTTEHVSTVFNSNEADIRMIAFQTEKESPTHEAHPENVHTSGSVQRNCFVCSTQELKGKFDISRAQALNVPKGPLFGTFDIFVSGCSFSCVLRWHHSNYPTALIQATRLCHNT